MKETYEPSGSLEREHGDKREALQPVFEQKAKEIERDGLKMMEELHDGKDVFHTSEHPKSMEIRADKIAEVLHASKEERMLAKMDIAYHDTIIEKDEADPGSVIGMIKRHRGAREGDKPNGAEGNEAKSADELIKRMIQANEEAGEEVFTETHMKNARWAIDATYPDVALGADFKGAAFEEYPYYEIAIRNNSELGELLAELKEQGITKGALFYQPHMETPLEKGEKVPNEVLMTALADLGASGMGSVEEFAQEGDNEMRELLGNLRKEEVLERVANGDEEADVADRGKAAAMCTGWLESQPSFAVWQALRFEKIAHLMKEKQGMADEDIQGLRKLFGNYAQNVRGQRDRAREVKSKYEEIKTSLGEKESFKYLARTMHYEIK
ncbi:MAG: hypothetical protein Q8R30_01225 [bacterium]|nr:hypothetical protein [bacterium]MDZ4285868.1 hypothetical protein [Candidatus Sungbacteria bacterium]